MKMAKYVTLHRNSAEVSILRKQNSQEQLEQSVEKSAKNKKKSRE